MSHLLPEMFENKSIDLDGFICDLCSGCFVEDYRLKKINKIISSMRYSGRHNAYPISPEGGKCCDKCNERVIEARLKNLQRTDDIVSYNEIAPLIIEYIKDKTIGCINKYTDLGILKSWMIEGDPSLKETAMMVFDIIEGMEREALEINAVAIAEYATKIIAVGALYTIETISSWPTTLCLLSLREIMMNEQFNEKVEELIECYEEHAKEKADLIAKKLLAEAEEKTKSDAKGETDNKKSATRNANKERDAKKREREEFERRAMECAKEKARQDALKKQKKAQQKAKAKK